MKHLVFVTREPAIDRADFGAQLLETAKAFSPCIVHLADVNPPWPIDPLMGELAVPQAYDALIEWSGSDTSDLLRPIAALPVAALHGYRVEEWVERPIPPAAPQAGVRVTQISLMQGYVGMDTTSIMPLWDAHMALALRVQAAADSYIRYRVEASFGDAAPLIFGVSCAGFPDQATLVEGQFDSPEAAYALLENSSHFVADETLIFASEWRLAGERPL